MESDKQLSETGFVLGLVIAPAVAPISFILCLFTLGMIDSVVDAGIRSLAILGWIFLAVTYGFFLSYLAAWAFGLPYYLWLARTGRLNFRNAIAPVIVLAILFLLLGVALSFKEPTLTTCLCWLLCVLVATVPLILSVGCFWLISVRRCPGRIDKQETSATI